MEDGEYGSIGEESEQIAAGRLVNYQEPEIQREMDRTANDMLCLKEGVNLTEEESRLLKCLGEVNKMDRTRLPSLRGD